MAVGVVLAFAWNMTMSQPQAAETGSGVTPQVGLTVEDAAAQAWASATPRAATDDARPSSPSSSRPAGHPRGSARAARRGCRVTPRTPERTLQARNISACGQRGRVPKQAETESAVSASIAAWTRGQRGAGRASRPGQ